MPIGPKPANDATSGGQKKHSIQSRAHALSSHNVLVDEKRRNFIIRHQTAQDEPRGEEERHANFERPSIRRRDRSRAHMRCKSTEASTRTRGHQLMVTSCHAKERTRPAVRRDEIAERHDAQQLELGREVEVDVALRYPCRKQEGNGSGKPRLPCVGAVER